VVAVLLDGGGPGAGRLQPGGADPLGEAEDALGAPEAIQRTLPEQRLDEPATGRPDLGRPLLTPGGGLQEEVHLVRGEVIQERSALAGAGRR
jgi:hypothetical protein